MSSWVIVGAARGIGFEYVNQLSADPKNTVIALIRSQNTAATLNELASTRKNIHVLVTDISSPARLADTAEQISHITGGKLDVLVQNAYLEGTEAMPLTPTAFIGKEAELERELFEPIKVNVIHAMYTINTFLPMIRRGEQKKIIYITSGVGDIEVTRKAELPNFLGYSISKASGNIIMAKYAVELKHEGILSLAMSPGWVETDAAKKVSASPEAFQWMLSSFQKINPKVTGMISTEESVTDQLSVISSLDASKSGAFLSQHGNTDWF